MPAMKTYYYPLTIKEIYLDTFGHMNNATYLMLFEEARWELLTANHYGMKKIQSTGLGPTILEIQVKFSKELFLRDNIVIETKMISYEKKIGRLLQTMLRDKEICCTAEFVIALFDVKQRKIIPPTPEWLNAVGMEI